MIVSVKHKGLKELHETGKSRYVGADYLAKCEKILNALIVAKVPEEMKLPGFAFHSLEGNPTRYAVKVNKNWRVTFAWENGAVDVDLEDYH